MHVISHCPSKCPTIDVTRWWRKVWYLDTRGFILKKIQWHIHTGLWSLVNWWRKALMRHYIRCSWILMTLAVGLMDGLSLDSNRCILKGIFNGCLGTANVQKVLEVRVWCCACVYGENLLTSGERGIQE